MGVLVLKVSRLPFTGDEPGYLLQAESLWHDADLDLANNVGSGTRLGDITRDTSPDTVLRVGDALVPVQPPGLPLLLIPAVAVARSAGMEVNLARATAAGMAATMFALLFRTLSALRPQRQRIALLAVLATAFSLAGAPWIVLIYPEIAAGLCVAIVLHAVVTRYRGCLVVSGAAVAFLPWLSLRFVLVAALAVVVGLVPSRRRGVVLAACLFVSLVAVAAHSKATYGLWNPSAVYDSFTGGYRPSLVTRYRVGVGSLFSRSEGLFVVLPLSWLALVGAGRALRRWLLGTLTCGVLTVAYLVVVLPSGARGASPPPRLVVALVPLVVLGVWMSLSEHRAWLLCFGAAGVLGVASSVPYLVSSTASARLYGDDQAIRFSGQVPVYPRMHAALGTEGPSRLPAGTGSGSTTTWGPFQVVGGDWVVRTVESSTLPEGLPEGLEVSSSATSAGPYRTLAGQRYGATVRFTVPGYETWLRATTAGLRSAEPLEFQAVNPRSREGVVLAQAWKSALLVALAAAAVTVGYCAGPGDDQRAERVVDSGAEQAH